jgi:hypothetical protein
MSGRPLLFSDKVTTMPKVDFDFQRYVERRRGAHEAQAREGAAYAYTGDLKVLRTLNQVRPVRLAVEGTERLWRPSERSALAETTRVSSLKLPAIHALAARCAELLHITPPSVYVSEALGPLAAYTFGTNEDPHIVLDRTLIKELSEPELTDVLGRECGRIQNNHVVYATALYYVTHHANRFVRWAVTPAVLALKGWSRRAQITADRAGLLCTRDLDVSEAVLRKRFPEEPARIEALRLFAETAYYRGVIGQEGGTGAAECDAKVAELLAS